MARPSKHIQALDKRIRFNLTDLKRDGFLADAHQTGTLSWQWSAGHQVQLHLRIDLEMIHDDNEQQPRGQLELRYEAHSGPVRQEITLIRLASNLGKGGGVWYFLCPRTGSRCRTLLLDHQGFVSRQDIAGGLYRSQQRSKSEQAFCRF